MPWAFAVGLTLGSFVLVMLGAASPRYATIAFATLLLAVYTMIGMDQPGAAQPAASGSAPLLLAAGALWYGLLAIGWSALFVHRAVRQSLARVYDALGDYLDTKSQPVRTGAQAARGGAAAHSWPRPTRAVVDALNACRLSLVDRLDQRRRHAAMERSLRLYLTAQDIHERAASSHYPYQELAEAFFHSDVMFRGQRLMRAAGRRPAGARAEALRLGEAYRPPPEVDEALEDLGTALATRASDRRPAPASDMLQAVERLADNLDHLRQRIQLRRAPRRRPTRTASLHDPTPRRAWTRPGGASACA